MRILGIDPGTERCGFGLINDNQCLAFGTITARGKKVDDRLPQIMKSIERIINEHKPDVVAIEKHFSGKYANAVMALGEVRGIVKSLCISRGISYYDYEPKLVKKAVHSGSATKEQVAFMVRHILGLQSDPEPDAADALAVALCHQNRAIMIAKKAR